MIETAFPLFFLDWECIEEENATIGTKETGLWKVMCGWGQRLPTGGSWRMGTDCNFSIWELRAGRA